MFLFYRDLADLKYFPMLETLILDKNGLTGLENCPSLSHLHTLWCNNNEISDLSAFLDCVSEKFPKLRYLSIMRNPGCPGLMNLNAPDLDAIRLYRLYILHRLPQLVALDWSEVNENVRLESTCTYYSKCTIDVY
jgi:hypothetical protein